MPSGSWGCTEIVCTSMAPTCEIWGESLGFGSQRLFCTVYANDSKIFDNVAQANASTPY